MVVFAIRTHVRHEHVGNLKEWHQLIRPARLDGEPGDNELDLSRIGVGSI